MDKKLKNTVLFFVFTFIWTWLFYFAIIVLGLDPYQGTGMILLICGGCSPTFVAISMMLTTYKNEEKIDYLKRTYQLKRIGVKWWFFIILLFPVIFAVSIGTDLLTGGILPGMTNLRAVITSPISFIPLILLSFMSGPFSEEFGWRGFALDPLLGRFGFTKGSVLLGFVWGVWHLPLYFMPQTWHGQMGFQFAGFPTFILMSIGLAIIMSLVYVSTNRSILSALLMHLFSNFTAQLLAETSKQVEIFRSMFILVIAVFICVYIMKTKKNTSNFYRESLQIPR